VNKIHILSLSVRQQVALKLMLFNLYMSFVKKLMADLADSPSKSTLALKTGLMQDAFVKYNKLTELLALPSGEPGRSKMLKLHSSYMKYIVFAVRGFDAANCNLKESEIRIVQGELENLFDLVEDSSQFTYTDQEVEKWLGKYRR
jgi:hypothetical protein